MKIFFFLSTAIFLSSCKSNTQPVDKTKNIQVNAQSEIVSTKIADSTSWKFFLQHLPEKIAPIVDYKGKPVANQEKHFSIINYDVGSRDLQQCADALIRLRAEYLFAQNRLDEIGFHFTSNDYYRFIDYCKGKMPVPKGNGINFISSSPHEMNKESLRKYLDIVYTYAGTISLANELKSTDEFSIGTIIIHPGSPGHCFIITDEAKTSSGEKLFKLVEGYTPAQSIYVLKNTSEPELGFWHRLNKETITTASYSFENYQLKKFE